MRGNSDTEILVNAWSLYKEKVIKKLDDVFICNMGQE